MNILILVAIIPIIVIVNYIYTKDKNAEPKSLVKKVFWLGFAMAFPAVFFEFLLDKNYSVELSHDLLGCFCAVYIGVALVEEFVKWIVVMLNCYKNEEFDEVYDGIVYSVYASLGFACIENLLYVSQGGIGTGLIRAILSVPSHACFSVFMGYFLGKAKIFRNEKNKLEEIKYLLLSLLAPTFIHTIFDFLLFANGYFAFPIYVFYLFVGIQYIVCFIIVKRISKRSEKIVLRNGNEIHYCGNCGSGCDTTYCTKCGYQNRNK